MLDFGRTHPMEWSSLPERPIKCRNRICRLRDDPEPSRSFPVLACCDSCVHGRIGAGMAANGDILDCLIVGGGPAGLTTALYLARFKRRFVVVDSGTPRAAWIPTSHNIPVFAEGISGKDILARTRANLEQYGAKIQTGR